MRSIHCMILRYRTQPRLGVLRERKVVARLLDDCFSSLHEACTNNSLIVFYIIGKGKSSRNLTPEIEASGSASGSSHRPRGRVRRFLQKVKDGANKLRPHSKDSRTHSPAPPNVHDDDEPASSTPDIEVGSHTCPAISAF
ncbi:hypothetical protein BDR04DRAFT_51667 [Suillus decipiens]|nr:hypothetical protein BDR04DRAFT_51667 [Suillus decipiens]